MCANSFSTPSPEGFLPAGKLSPALLDALLATLPISDPQLVLGPSVGEDAAVIDFAGGDRLLVAKSDPITFATDEIGFYAVNVCANDLAVTGARPRFYLPTILLPAGETAETLVDVLFEQIGAACRRLSIVVAGGHTEITHAVNQPIVAGTMLGEVQRGRVVRSGGAHPGHVVLLAGSVPVEGASIIAREKRTELLDRGWSLVNSIPRLPICATPASACWYRRWPRPTPDWSAQCTTRLRVASPPVCASWLWRQAPVCRLTWIASASRRWEENCVRSTVWTRWASSLRARCWQPVRPTGWIHCRRSGAHLAGAAQ